MVNPPQKKLIQTILSKSSWNRHICLLFFNTLTTPFWSNSMCTRSLVRLINKIISVLADYIMLSYLVSVLLRLNIYSQLFLANSVGNLWSISIQNDSTSSPQFFLLVNSNELIKILVIVIYLNILNCIFYKLSE